MTDTPDARVTPTSYDPASSQAGPSYEAQPWRRGWHDRVSHTIVIEK